MDSFTQLLDRLYYTHSTLAKSALIRDYLASTPDPDRGWAIAAIAGELRFDLFKRNLIKTLLMERVDPVLFAMSYDYVGELSETAAHLWQVSEDALRLNRIPPLCEVIEQFLSRDKEGISQYLTVLMDNMTPAQRWALLKLGTRGLRIGVSARATKQILATYGKKDVSEIEALWHGLEPPYTSLFQWLEGKADKPDVRDCVNFHPVMLSHPLEEADYKRITAQDWQAEWKYDGIRVQQVSTPNGMALFSRTGDDISGAFPDVLSRVDYHAVLDGELLVVRQGDIAPFNDLQQRLGRKKPTGTLIAKHPAELVVYDALSLDGEDIQQLPLQQRQDRLKDWHAKHDVKGVALSQTLPFKNFTELQDLREQADRTQGNHIEGLMLKRKESLYQIGRPKGQWFKWKRDPLLVDAVIMYAQRGHGKRSSFYSDFTFGLWTDDPDNGGIVVPIGKAYSGFTDEELKLLDKWVLKHTSNRFGPVREVKKELVFEVAFDSVHESARHKSGVALRFPRIHRIRWDKPAHEADHLETLKKLL